MSFSIPVQYRDTPAGRPVDASAQECIVCHCLVSDGTPVCGSYAVVCGPCQTSGRTVRCDACFQPTVPGAAKCSRCSASVLDPHAAETWDLRPLCKACADQLPLCSLCDRHCPVLLASEDTRTCPDCTRIDSPNGFFAVVEAA